MPLTLQQLEQVRPVGGGGGRGPGASATTWPRTTGRTTGTAAQKNQTNSHQTPHGLTIRPLQRTMRRLSPGGAKGPWSP